MDQILDKSYKRILEDDKFVKLTVLSFLPYSLVFVGYIFYQVYFFINTLQHWIDLSHIKEYINQVFNSWELLTWVFLVAIIVWLISYIFIPPIAEWALISYLNKSWNKSSIWAWLLNFFQMFELHWFLSLFSYILFFIAISRLYIVWMLDNIFVISFLIIWLFFIFLINFWAIYAKYIVILEKKTAFDAIKQSFKLAFLNIRITFKYFIIYLILYIRILVNIVVLIWVPLFALYIFLKSGTENLEIVKYIVFFLMFLMFIITAYINGAIEAFFISIWNDIYHKIEKE